MQLVRNAVLFFMFVGCLCARTEPVSHQHARILGSLIYTDLSVSLDGEEAVHALAQFENDLGVLMQVYWGTENTEGCIQSAPIFLTLHNQPAVVVLERLIEQMCGDSDGTWQLRDGVLEIGFKSRFGKKGSLQLVTYPINDLLFTVRDFDAPDLSTGGGPNGGIGGGTPEADTDTPSKEERIIELLTKYIEPEQWEQQGGEASITTFRETLLIRAPDFVHRQIGGYPFQPRRPEGVRVRRVQYSNGNTKVRVTRPSR